MKVIDCAIRIAEAFPALGSLPTPAWVSRALAAHERRRRLVFDIACLGGSDVAFVALWLARAWAVRSPSGTVEGALEMFKRNLTR